MTLLYIGIVLTICAQGQLFIARRISKPDTFVSTLHLVFKYLVQPVAAVLVIFGTISVVTR